MNKSAVFRLKLSSYSPNSLCTDVFPPCLYTGYLQILRVGQKMCFTLYLNLLCFYHLPLPPPLPQRNVIWMHWFELCISSLLLDS